MSILQKIADLGLTLPAVPAPIAAYVNCVRTGNLLFLSGGLPIDGDKKDDSREVLSWGVTCGVSLTRNVGLKLGYIDQSTQRQTGSDLGHFVAAVSVMW